jgi:FSR family fosmidomycin resistance protein-like MFS transporter
MKRENERTLWGEAIGHGAHDTWFGVAPVLLAALSASMHLTNAEIGLVLLLYQVLSSLTQPFFGRLAERVGGRPLAVGSILWTTLMFSAVLFVQAKWQLALCLALAGFGSGAWHPQGAANSTVAGGAKWGATAASIFFLGGTLGSAFLGSALGGFLLGTFGRHSLLLVSAITVVLALTFVRRMVPQRLTPAAPSRRASNNGAALDGAFWALFACLLLATALRSLAYHTMNTYIPKYQQDLGVSPATYGVLMSLFLFATAIGGVVGAYLADRVGLRPILIGSLALAAVTFLAFMRGHGFWGALWLVLAGICVGPSHTLFVVAGQRLFPQRMAMISGLFLGFTFVSGAGGAWLLGLLADHVGLATTLGLLPWILMGATVIVLVGVPGARLAQAPEPSPSG